MRAYAREISTGITAHYPGRHIREWHQDDFTMSSRELLNLIEGMPFDSWLRSTIREDMDELVGDATVETLRDVKEKTEAALRGEVRVHMEIEETEGHVRRVKPSANQARPQARARPVRRQKGSGQGGTGIRPGQ